MSFWPSCKAKQEARAVKINESRDRRVTCVGSSDTVPDICTKPKLYHYYQLVTHLLLSTNLYYIYITLDIIFRFSRHFLKCFSGLLTLRLHWHKEQNDHSRGFLKSSTASNISREFFYRKFEFLALEFGIQIKWKEFFLNIRKIVRMH